MRNRLPSRILALLLVLTMLMSMTVSVSAVESSLTIDDDTANLSFELADDDADSLSMDNEAEEAPEVGQIYADTDSVRVSIVLEAVPCTVQAISMAESLSDTRALAYRERLQEAQIQVEKLIENELAVEELDVVWNLTLAANMISANVEYGQIEDIKSIDGVKDVIIEVCYEATEESTVSPNMASSSNMIGTTTAWAEGYTGAGSRIAVIDTGLDTDHQSFGEKGYLYSLQQQAEKAGLDYNAYVESLKLLGAEEIAGVWEQLNISSLTTASKVYLNEKVPFAYNYVDTNLDVTHDHDTQGEHGSHVAGIAAANAYISNGDGTFSNALDSVMVAGAAPDAQLLIMKVFGAKGGAYESDYLAAVEDALVLGADAINLSMGSATAGFSRSSTYAKLYEELENYGTVVVISQGNSYSWAEYDANIGYLYNDEVNYHTGGSPGTYVNSLAVASVENDGITDLCLTVGDHYIFYAETTSYGNSAITTIAGEQEYIFLDSIGSEEEFSAIADVLEGKVAVCARGGISFYEKANAAVANGAIGVVIYNNEDGMINMDLSGYHYSAPCVSISKADGQVMKESAEAVYGEGGKVLYCKGTMTVSDTVMTAVYNSDYYTMSDFSSWGVPGSLVMKPEITAPGGNIRSVDGSTSDTAAYETMSGTSMAAPQISGMVALASQYYRESELLKKTDLSARQLTHSLLMSTAEPIQDGTNGGAYYSVLEQGAGLANISNLIAADSYILMDSNANDSYDDGKVKVELGDDPQRTGEYNFSFTLYNLTDEAQNYSLYTDLFTQAVFTQDGVSYLDRKTDSLSASVTWTANGTVLLPSEDLSGYDFNHDGVTNSLDADALMEYVINGAAIAYSEKADLSGDGQVTTYDVYLLLRKLDAGSVTLPANSSVKLGVSIELTDAQKAELDANTPNGAYVEGYIFVSGETSEEGVEGTQHSIPLLGYYGNWSDPSMYEGTSYTDALYGNTRVPHVGTAYTNNLIFMEAGNSTLYWHSGNPYIVEAEYPAERAAFRSDVTIYSYRASLIRNAAALMGLITDEQGNILYSTDVVNQVNAAYYSASYGSWMNYAADLNLKTKISSLGVQEGDRITVQLVSVPEYYETDGAAISADELIELTNSGVLGEGTTLSTTITVDDTAPQLLSVQKDLTTGDLTVTAQDNEYIAAVIVTNVSGTKVLAKALAEQDEQGEAATAHIELSGVAVGTKCRIVVADYAENETSYVVEYGGEPIDYSGKFYAFATDDSRGTANSWLELFPDSLYYYDSTNYAGSETQIAMDLTITAAEYVDGYVFMAADDGSLYAAEHDNWTAYRKVGTFSGTTAQIYDLAYNYADNSLYALCENSKIYRVNTLNGALELVCTVSALGPNGYSAGKLISFAIDDDGTFYAVNSSMISGASTYLYKWTLEDVSEQAVKVDAIGGSNVINSEDSATNFCCGTAGTMAWDHDNDVLYWLNYAYASAGRYLWIFDTENGTASRPSLDAGELDPYYASKVYTATKGFYIVPKGNGGITPSDEVTGVELNRNEMTLLVGGTLTLRAEVFPWTVENNEVVWSSDDESVATIGSSGLVTAVGVGQTIIRATSAADSAKYAECKVNVKETPDIDFSGFLFDSDTNKVWANFNTNNLSTYEELSEKTDLELISGCLMEDQIYVSDGNYFYSVDADTFEVSTLGVISSSWAWCDAAPAPRTSDGYWGKLAAICGNGLALEMIDPYTLTTSYKGVSSALGGDCMAAIAYIGSGTYNYYCPACYYYVVTEGGDLWKVTAYTYTWSPEFSYDISMEKIGNVGVKLSGVATYSSYASMIYDEESGYLVLSSYQEGDTTTSIYLIDPENCYSARVGDIGSGNWPLVSLYQYDQLTDLAIFMRTPTVSIYETDTYQLVADIKCFDESDKVEWSSSNEDVVTVDENGVITAHSWSWNTVKITATTVETNDAGERLSATAYVIVNPLTDIDTNFGAQIVTEDGDTQWITVAMESGEITITVEEESDVTFKAGGMSGGVIYGTDASEKVDGYVYRVDSDNGYAMTKGYAVSGGMAPGDFSNVPLIDYGEYLEDEDFEGFGMPFYVTRDEHTVMADTKLEGIVYSEDMSPPEWNLTTAAYYRTIMLDLGWGRRPYHQLLALGNDGKLHGMFLAGVMEDDGSISYHCGARYGGYSDLRFEDDDDLSISITPDKRYLLIACSGADGKVSLYYINLETMDMDTGYCESGKVANFNGVTAISCLYTDYDKQREMTLTELDSVDPVVPEFNAESLNIPLSMDWDLNEEYVAANEESNSSLNSVVRSEAQSGSEENSDAITLLLTAKDAGGVDAATTNGKIKVTYDANLFQLVSVQKGNTNVFAYSADDNGTVTFGYAAYSEIAAGESLATVILARKESGSSQVAVTTEESGSEYPGYTEVLILLDESATGPSEPVTPAPTPGIDENEETGSNPFTDVEENSWYEDAVYWAVDNGITKGTGDGTTFEPYLVCDRAQVVTFLWRIADCPMVDYAMDYSDVTENEWYSEAVRWASSTGITKGTGDGSTFEPDLTCDRAQIVTFLYRFMEMNGADMSLGESTDILSFADALDIPDYAFEAMQWACGAGVMQGDGTNLMPLKACTRAEIVTLLYRALNALLH